MVVWLIYHGTVHENIFWSTLLRLALMDFDQTKLELYISSKTRPYKLWKRWIDNIDIKDMVSLYSRVLRKWKVVLVCKKAWYHFLSGHFSSKNMVAIYFHGPRISIPKAVNFSQQYRILSSWGPYTFSQDRILYIWPTFSTSFLVMFSS